MAERAEELAKLKTYTADIDNDLTMILQNLQWDRKHIFQHPSMVSCKYDSNHKILTDKAEVHEPECLLRQNGYTKEDRLLPDPLRINANTLIKFSKEDIQAIINNAAILDPSFKRGLGSGDVEPHTLERLRGAYSVDERRAIHDAVIAALPFSDDLSDLALASIGEDGQVQKKKSRTEILAELRDMKRRRTKYRVATKSKNYSDVLRDVINTQMELYTGVLGEAENMSNVGEHDATTISQVHHERNDDTYSRDDNYRHVQEFNKRDRNNDNERYKKDRPERDNTREYNDRQSISYNTRDGSEMSRESQYRKRSHDYKTRDIDSNRRNRDRSRDIRYESKERAVEEKRDYRRKDSHTEKYGDKHSREQKYTQRLKQHDRSKEKYYDKDESDKNRARNLIKIKQEIEGIDNANNTSKYKVEVNKKDRYRDYVSRDSSYHRRKQDDNSHRHSDRDRKDRSRDKHRGESSKEYRHKVSRRDTSYERDVRKSGTADKHKTYYEIYADIEKRIKKENDVD